MVLAELNGIHTKRVNYKSTKIFYILQGSLKVKNDLVEKEVTKDSLICIPPNIGVELLGINCKFIIICTPPYDPADEKIHKINN